jgi:hypothetical protein
MSTTDDKCVFYLEMFRDGNYLELCEILNKETPQFIAAFCYYLAKYEGVNHLDFLRKLMW